MCPRVASNSAVGGASRTRPIWAEGAPLTRLHWLREPSQAASVHRTHPGNASGWMSSWPAIRAIALDGSTHHDERPPPTASCAPAPPPGSAVVQALTSILPGHQPPGIPRWISLLNHERRTDDLPGFDTPDPPGLRDVADGLRQRVADALKTPVGQGILLCLHVMRLDTVTRHHVHSRASDQRGCRSGARPRSSVGVRS